MKINGQKIIVGVDLGDARAGYPSGKFMRAHEISAACNAALRRRGIKIEKFNKFEDFTKRKPAQE